MAHPAADDVTALYERHASEWGRGRRLSPVERRWLERFVALIPPGGRVLDLGCGDGDPIGRWLLGRGLRVTGLDASPALIARARATLPAGEWFVGDMRDIKLEGRFDGALAWFSLFHLTAEDQRAVLLRVGQLLTPGAPLLFPSGDEEGEAIGSWCGEPLYHASLSREGYAAALARAGFIVESLRPGRSGGGPETVWLTRRGP